LKQKIIIIDDDQSIRKLLTIALKSSGYETIEASNIEEALSKSAINSPDMVLLDLGLPDGDGLRFIKSFREWSNVPLIVVSAVSQEDKKVTAFELGADDYLVKPFSTNELLARIRAFLRRYDGAVSSHILECGDLIIDLSARSVALYGEAVKMTPKEYELLKLLMQNMGKVLTHNMLLKEVWGVGYQNEIHYLRVFINQLRQKIEKDPSRPSKIITETGIGYRMSALAGA
jgi:two-component system, OmpR family, KDP operon response regulator KdpE